MHTHNTYTQHMHTHNTHTHTTHTHKQHTHIHTNTHMHIHTQPAYQWGSCFCHQGRIMLHGCEIVQPFPSSTGNIQHSSVHQHVSFRVVDVESYISHQNDTCNTLLSQKTGYGAKMKNEPKFLMELECLVGGVL